MCFWDEFLASEKRLGPIQVGPYTSYGYRVDPRGLLFRLARYKFAAKMLQGKQHVLEIGCGDGFAMPLIRQCVDDYTGSDIEEHIIEGNKERFANFPNANFICMNFAKERALMGDIHLSNEDGALTPQNNSKKSKKPSKR